MPIENFEEAALSATYEDRPRRVDWMEMLQRRDDQAELRRRYEEHRSWDVGASS